MNIALVIAGGSGQRMCQEVPKQFLHVNDKPVIIYTLEAFQKHPDIDEVGVVCIDGWHDMLAAYARQFHIDKCKWITSGGKCGQESIYNGLQEAKKRYDDNDLILIHDAIRPMVSQDIISDCIIQCGKYGTAISAVPCTTAVLEYSDSSKATAKNEIDRKKLAMTQTPQAFPLEKLLWAHDEAIKRGIRESVATCTLMAELGQELHFSLGSETNIKLTTQADLEIFKALLQVKNQGKM